MNTQRLIARLRRPILGHPLGVWLLWALAALVLACCPMMLSDPAMWFYLLDPELLALLVLVGAQYTRLQLMLFRARVRGRSSRAECPPVRTSTRAIR